MLSRRRSPTPVRFRRPRQRTGRWRKWAGFAVFLALMAGWWFALRPAMDAQGWVTITDRVSVCGQGPRSLICAVDGDTLVVGSGPKHRRIRLTGFDAPEMDGPCKAERDQAIKSRAALAEWLSHAPFEWDGAADPPRDQYGRELRAVRRTARDGSREWLAEVMIARGLAADNGWGAGPRDWCAAR